GGAASRRLAALALIAPVTAGLVTASPAPASSPGASPEPPAAGAPTGEYIVVLKDTENVRRRGVPNRARELAERRGARAGKIYQHALKGFTFRGNAQQAREVAADPDVAFVEEDRVISLTAQQVNPPSWGLDRIDQRR